MDCARHVLAIPTMGAFSGPDGKTLLDVGGGTAAKLIKMIVPQSFPESYNSVDCRGLSPRFSTAVPPRDAMMIPWTGV